MTEPCAHQPAVPSDGTIFGPHRLTQFLILLAAGAACTIYWAVGRWLDIPREPGFSGSLLQSPQAALVIVVAVVLLFVCAAIGHLIAGWRWAMAGLFAAVVGLTVWSVRGGTMQFVLFRAENAGTGPAIFLRLLLELLILFGAIAIIWNGLWLRAVRSRPVLERDEQTKEEGRSTGAALVAQLGMTALLAFVLLVETPAKKQVLVSLFLAGMAGSALAESFFATRDSWRWYWVAPLVVGIFGYVIAYFQPAGIQIGHLSGTFAPFARALPLDYASLGCAGALIGHWLSAPEPGEEEEMETPNPDENPRS